MKRAAEPGTAVGGGKSSKGEPGGAGGSGGQSVTTNLIPRPFRVNSATFHINQRTWEELSAGELKYLPLCQSPFYMLDDATKGLLNKYRGLWSTMTINKPSARISNIMLMQDDYVTTGGTPQEMTSLMQSCYMLSYTPQKQSLYFKLANMTTCNKNDVKVGENFNYLVYNLGGSQCDAGDIKQLITLGNYEDFEHLAILTANVDEFAGFEPRGVVKQDKSIVTGYESSMYNTFIPPNRLIGDYAYYCANMQPVDEEKKKLVVKPFEQVTWARNLDKISIHKYGDVINLPINTNIEGRPLLNTSQNDLMTRQTRISDKDGTYDYYTDFVWPSQNRPFYSRADNLSEIDPLESPKIGMAPLTHHFLTMPPIRKANGALLKQRASFILEQSYSITFNFPESVWDEAPDDDTFATSTNILNQKDAIIVRPVIYGHCKTARLNEKAICPTDLKEGGGGGDKTPFDNSFESLKQLLIEYQTSVLTPEAKTLFQTRTEEESENMEVDHYSKGAVTNDMFTNSSFQFAWQKFIVKAQGALATDFIIDLGGAYTGVILSLTADDGRKLSINTGQRIRSLALSVDHWKKILIWAEIKCDAAAQYAPTVYHSVDRDSTIFYV